jgi:hypothetical protein
MLPGSPMRPRSSLHRASSPTTAHELDALRRRAWHEHGVASLPVQEITDPWLRQALINEATKRWGRRMGGNHGR